MVPVTVRRAVPALFFLAWLTATSAFGGCDYFKPADPEQPTNLDPIIPNYSNPTLTLQTIARGIMDKSQTNGQDVYMGAFAESSTIATNPGDGRGFHAFFDAQDLRENPTWDPAEDWDRGDEPRLYGGLVRLFSNNYEMTWEPYPPAGNEEGSLDDSLLHRKYRIVQLIRNANTGQITRSPVAVGAADLRFVRSARDANKWVIAIWDDFHTRDADSAMVTLGARRLQNQ